ncbi:MAG: ABC transporter permease [Beijerinckiaceae bacterium]|nr:ABC transporter permease [Beijerinckiaceae bacterium]
MSVSNAIDQPAVRPAAARNIARTFWQTLGRRLRRDPVSILCFGFLVAIVLMALFAPWIAPADPYQVNMLQRLQPPGTEGFILGTDELGRDLLSRLMYGARMSLFMGLAPVFIATIIGGTLGVVAGYAGGWVNTAIMRVMDVFYAFPSVLLAVAISGSLGGGVRNGLIALSLVFTPSIARVAESVTVQVRTQDYVEAARATGAPAWRILMTHVLRNVAGTIFVFSTSLVSVSIIIASGLSFLGLGVSLPEAEWGMMLSSMRQSVYLAPLNSVLPGVMIFVTSVSLNLLSDGIRSAMNVKG